MVQVNQCFNNRDRFGATHLSFPLEMESIILKRLISGERLKAKKIPIKQANSKGKVIYYTFIICALSAGTIRYAFHLQY